MIIAIKMVPSVVPSTTTTTTVETALVDDILESMLRTKTFDPAFDDKQILEYVDDKTAKRRLRLLYDVIKTVTAPPLEQALTSLRWHILKIQYLGPLMAPVMEDIRDNEFCAKCHNHVPTFKTYDCDECVDAYPVEQTIFGTFVHENRIDQLFLKEYERYYNYAFKLRRASTTAQYESLVAKMLRRNKTNDFFDLKKSAICTTCGSYVPFLGKNCSACPDVDIETIIVSDSVEEDVYEIAVCDISYKRALVSDNESYTTMNTRYVCKFTDDGWFYLFDELSCDFYDNFFRRHVKRRRRLERRYADCADRAERLELRRMIFSVDDKLYEYSPHNVSPLERESFNVTQEFLHINKIALLRLCNRVGRDKCCMFCEWDLEKCADGLCWNELPVKRKRKYLHTKRYALRHY